MEGTSIILTCLVFSPFLALLFIAFMSKQEVKTIRTLAVLGTIPPLVLSSWLFIKYHQGYDLALVEEARSWLSFGFFPVDEGPRPFSIEYELAVNGFSLLMLWLTSILTTVASVAAFRIQEKVKGYYVAFYFLFIGMLGVFASNNLFLFFLFFELTLVSLFFLIGKWGDARKEKAAYSYLIYNGIGSALLLLVIAFIFATTGTTSIDELTSFFRNDDSFQSGTKAWLAFTLFIAFGIKLPIFPFHTWMLNVHVHAPPAAVILHAGILLKIGAYGLIQFGFGFFPSEFQAMSPLLLLVGLVNLLYGAVLALIQTEFKRVLAYSSVSHMGIVLLGLGAVNEAGVQGAIFQVISHGFIAALLFFLVNTVEMRFQTTDLARLGGLAHHVPKLAGFLLVASLASLGLPSMSGFISELMAFVGVFQTSLYIGAFGVIALILTAVYMLRAVLAITFGQRKEEGNHIDLKWFETLSVSALTAFIFGIGLFPQWVTDSIINTVQIVLNGMGG